MKGITALFIVLTISLSQTPAWAFETDQYNLPPEPLADIGVEVTEYTAENVRAAILKINKEIEERQQCVAQKGENSRKCDAKNAERVAYLRSDAAVTREVFDRLGYGLIAFAKAGNWIDSHRFRAQPARYKTSYRRSIYALVPTNYFTLSPTVNLYGSSFGTDKIAHFFQQGYTYYRIRQRALEKGSSEQEAERKAVSWGRMTEKTYYGTLVGGVFSNADLAANYAGMKFYERLTKPIILGGTISPAMLLLKDGMWTINDEANIEALLRPFISNHLNEALNPSVFAPGLRSFVRSTVRKQSCQEWTDRFPGRTKDDFERSTDALTLWNGEDYGFRKSDKFVTIANTCFGDPSSSLRVN